MKYFVYKSAKTQIGRNSPHLLEYEIELLIPKNTKTLKLNLIYRLFFDFTDFENFKTKLPLSLKSFIEQKKIVAISSS
jgi:hypothetical protein